MARLRSCAGWLLGTLTLLLATSATAQTEGAAVNGPLYLPLKPTFVVNYGGTGRLRYLKTDLSVRVADASAANAVRHHLPYIRNNLVMLLASQTDASIESQAGKEALRKEVLAEIRTVLHQEEGIDGVVDVYFDSFVVQR